MAGRQGQAMRWRNAENYGNGVFANFGRNLNSIEIDVLNRLESTLYNKFSLVRKFIGMSRRGHVTMIYVQASFV